jgi:hypothetical protein
MLITLLLLADLKALIEKNGSTFTTTVTEDCTHLVTTEKDVEKQTTKCQSTIAGQETSEVWNHWAVLSASYHHINTENGGGRRWGVNDHDDF